MMVQVLLLDGMGTGAASLLGLCTGQHRGVPRVWPGCGRLGEEAHGVPLVKELGRGPWGGGESGDVEKETTFACALQGRASCVGRTESERETKPQRV